MASFRHQSLRFHYLDRGQGLPLVLQHGLGGSAQLVCSLVRPPQGVRLISMDARGHGQSDPPLDAAQFNFYTFADDLRALLDHLGLQRAVVGGISLGAGVGLNLALRFPERVQGLVLIRPAWLNQPNPWNVRMFGLMARLLRAHGPERAQALFVQTEEYRETLRRYPDTARSLALQFTGPHAQWAAARLEAFAQAVPWPDRKALGTIHVPTLVLANRLDPVHPFEVGEALARAIPGAELREITSKSVNAPQHTRDVQRHLEEFLRRHFSPGPGAASPAAG